MSCSKIKVVCPSCGQSFEKGICVPTKKPKKEKVEEVSVEVDTCKPE